MNSRKYLAGALFSAALMSLSGAANAGGLYISEFGHPAQGTSAAGSGVLTDDASTAFTNPAGVMALDESQWMATGIAITGSTKFDTDSTVGVNGNNGGDAFESAVGAAFFYANPFHEKFGFGLAFNSVAGAGLDYDPGFVGRYWAEELEMLTVTLTPSFSYRVNDQWSVAVGVGAIFGRLDMDVAIPAPVNGPINNGDVGTAKIEDGDDVSAAIALSALYEINDRTRLGFAYVGENELNFDSDLNLQLDPGLPGPIPTIGADIEIVFPQAARIWGSRQVGNNLTLLATIGWEDWSSFDSVPITTSTGTSAALPRNWGDTYKFALGMKWDTGGSGRYYTGVAYDTDPTNASDRTADMPIDSQWRLSFGGNWDTSERMRLGAVLTYTDLGEAKIQNGGLRPGTGNPWQVNGDYSTNRAVFIGLNLNYK